MNSKISQQRTRAKVGKNLGGALFLLVAAAGGGFTNALADDMSSPVISQTKAVVPVEHRTLILRADYDAFTRNLVHLLGHFDPADAALGATDRDHALSKLRASQGEQGLMLFDVSNDHGALFPLAGLPARKAVRYHIGNPLIAITMTRKNIGAALYAPMTMVAYEAEPGTVRVEYDLPSSSLAQFHDSDIDKVAAQLDSKLLGVVTKAAEASK